MADTRIRRSAQRALRRLPVIVFSLLLLPACRTNRLSTTPVSVSVSTSHAAALRSPAAWTTPRAWNEAPAGRLTRTPDALVAEAPDREPAIGVEAELGLFSKYVWRGQLFTDDPVLQPAVTLRYGDWRFVTWGNLELTGVSGSQGEFSEVDLLLEHTHDLGGATLLAGLGWYAFPSLPFAATVEIYAGIEFDVLLHPSVTLYYDVDEVDGIYASLGVSEDVSLAGGTLSLAGTVGWGDNKWNQFSWGTPSEGCNDFVVRASWTWSEGRWTITPSVAWSVLLDGDVRAAAASTDDWILGLVAGFTL